MSKKERIIVTIYMCLVLVMGSTAIASVIITDGNQESRLGNILFMVAFIAFIICLLTALIYLFISIWRD